MINSSWTETDSEKAKQIREEYQQQNDLSKRVGQTVGIDPNSGRLWFGESIREVVAKRNADGVASPLFFERIGSEIYYRKGSHH